MQKYIVYGFSFCLIVIAVSIFRPVPMVQESKAIAITGKVDVIHGTKNHDIFIYLKDVPQRFYINRGTEAGLSVSDLSDKLEGEIVTLKYPKYWTPLDWNNRVKHISKLEYGQEVIFNELKKG
jgi:hypothetical protein